MAKKRLHVAVGVILKDRSVLISCRQSGKHLAGKWEFPGGKVETAETVVDALARELFEELNIQIHTPRTSHLINIEYNYPEVDVLLDCWLVTDFSGEPAGKEGQAIQWVAVDQLADIDFPDANEAVIQDLNSILANEV